MGDKTPALSETTNPSRDELFRLLTEEIKDITEAEKLKGWTPWVIVASLTSGLWIVTRDLLLSPYSKRACVAVFLIVTVILHVLRIMQRDLDELSRDRSDRVSFFFLHSTSSAFSVLTVSIWMTGIAYAVFRLAPFAANPRIFHVGSAVYAVVATVFLSMMIPIVARLPIPMHRRAPRPFLFAFVSSAVITALVALVIGITRSGLVHNLTIIEIRIGTIAALAALGIVILSRSLSERGDSREALSEIRRDLVLGAISLADASRRARTILQGMWLSDIAMRDMHKLLKLISTARTEYEAALGKIAMFTTQVDTGAMVQLPDVGRLTLGNMLDTLEAHEARVCNIIVEYHRLLMSLRLRLNFVTKLGPDAQPDSRRLVAEIEMAQGPVDHLQDQFGRQFLELQRAWNLRFPNDQRNHDPFAQLRKRRSLKPDLRLWWTGE